MKRILVTGKSDSIFINRLLKNIHELGCSELEIELFDNHHYSDELPNKGFPYRVHGVEMPKWCRKLVKIPVLRIFIRMLFEYTTLKKILSNGCYDAINIQELPFYSWIYVKCVHKHGIKAILTPIGSDALRVKGWTSMLLQKGFDMTDYVTITADSGFAEKVIGKFNINRNKIRDLSYGSDAISEIILMKRLHSREELAQMLNIPYADYYICCGYNAHRAQNHADMLRAIAANAEILPKGYKVLIPLGYGGGNPIRKELEQENIRFGLDIVFLMDYLSPKEVAALRLITDLFIHIQDTDAHCFTMREFLLAETQVINGRWLSYPELEQYGLPYYVCESKDTLKDTLAAYFKGALPPIQCTAELKRSLQQSSWNNVAQCWLDFYTRLN